MKRQQRPVVAGTTSSVRDVTYQFPNSTIAARVSLEDVRTHWSLGLTLDERHPFVATIDAYRMHESLQLQESPLWGFFKSHQPRSAAELLGVDQPLPKLRALAALEVGLPWWPASGHLSPSRLKRAQIEASRREHRQHGGAPSEQELGISFFGPTSREKIESEFCRLIRLFESIRQSGYVEAPQRSDGIPIADVLVTGDSEVYVLYSGHHRTAVLYTLGMKDVLIRVGSGLGLSLVHREDVVSWPGVRTKLFTATQALQIFDRIADNDFSA